MDIGLGTNQKPPLSKVVEWLSEQRIVSIKARSLVALSIHGPSWEEWFKEVISTGLILIYLSKPKEQLKQHLGNRREEDQKYTIESYDSLAAIFKELADYRIDCADKDIATVAGEVRDIMDENFPM